MILLFQSYIFINKMIFLQMSRFKSVFFQFESSKWALEKKPNFVRCCMQLFRGTNESFLFFTAKQNVDRNFFDPPTAHVNL